MKKRLLEVLACPSCSGDLLLKDEVTWGSEISSGTLCCVSCPATFEVIEGVPCFLDGEELETTRRNFNEQWRLAATGTFTSAVVRQPEPAARDLLANFGGAVRHDDWILDAGCGPADVAAALALQAPECQVVALDFSDMIRTFAKSYPHIANLHFVQANVVRLPLRRGAFRGVCSFGVLHHTADTKEAFDAVSRVVADGGSLAIWIYPHASEHVFFMSTVYFTRDVVFMGRGHRIPPGLRLWLVRLYALFALPLAYVWERYFRGQEGMDRYVGDELPSPIELYRAATLLLYDDISPEFQHRHTGKEVAGWYVERGFARPELDGLGAYWARRSGAG